MEKFACTKDQLSCIISNLFVELLPVCELCNQDKLVIKGTTYEGKEEYIIINDFGFEYSGQRETIDEIRNKRCIR
ncbi:hypothetical protein [Tepidanaerobacter syntrophicus]|uniref:Uncharacterized protein n=1 Tax=Tepidanaerobacter syntrophicus TaxID=224999 RepID=A0A0U9HJK1_9FIRM|nr:hypothetical protein [Tepidanaerobacter syntrophicus]GAQ24207.1 hypothetical protein TSYNT_533 [Tepidanaerobacter syntrophicus]